MYLTLTPTGKVISFYPEITCVEICLKEVIPKPENLHTQ